MADEGVKVLAAAETAMTLLEAAGRQKTVLEPLLAQADGAIQDLATILTARATVEGKAAEVSEIAVQVAGVGAAVEGLTETIDQAQQNLADQVAAAELFRNDAETFRGQAEELVTEAAQSIAAANERIAVADQKLAAVTASADQKLTVVQLESDEVLAEVSQAADQVLSDVTEGAGQVLATIQQSKEQMLDLANQTVSQVAANFDTLTAANAAIGTYVEGAGININADGSNNGFYVKQSAAWVRKSTATLPGLDTRSTFLEESRLRPLERTIRSATQLQSYDATDDILPVLADANGTVLLGARRSTGEIVASIPVNDPSLKRASQRTVDAALSPGGALQSYNADGATRYYPIVVDEVLGLVLGVDRQTGVLVGSGISALKTPVAAPKVALTGVRPTLALGTGWMHVISYGQSLSAGIKGNPPLSQSQPYSNLTFGAGPRSTKAGNTFGGTNPGTDTVKPLVEDTNTPEGNSASGETVCSGAANWAVEAAARESAIDPAQLVILASAPGHGGYGIANLRKSAPWYQNFLDHVSEGKARAAAVGKSYNVPVVVWMQGESDATAASPRTWYRDQLLQLRADINADVLAITGQANPVHLVVYQTPSAPSPGTRAAMADIALAQLDAINASPYIHFGGSIEHLPYNADGVHLTNIGQLRYGRHLGRAWKQIVVDGNEPDAIWPISATAKGTTLSVKFRVPTLPLVVDKTLLGSSQDCGFKVVDDTGTLTVTGAAIGAGDTVVITLDRALGSNPKVRYALDYLGQGVNLANGATGNLRDSTPDTCTIAGVAHPMWHVAPKFELSIIKLDANS
ncbi:sialate O-acetylesterase [Microvirga sp. RSM25]|uniref:sialate O-acetylesterase n=1 Tax=Microvirga sp. RSM25 TaxID=3273802 RepID=UPI00384AD996